MVLSFFPDASLRETLIAESDALRVWAGTGWPKAIRYLQSAVHDLRDVPIPAPLSHPSDCEFWATAAHEGAVECGQL